MDKSKIGSIIFFTLLTIMVLTPFDVLAQKSSPANLPPRNLERYKKNSVSKLESQKVKKAADRFIKLFRRRLEFGDAFDQMFVADAVSRMRNANYFGEFSLGSKLISTSDDALLKRIYIAVMNDYYLKAAYDLSTQARKGNEENGDPPLPLEIYKELKTSKYLFVLLNEVDEKVAEIRTTNELEEYIAEFTKVSGLYRKYLPRKWFDSLIYKNNIQDLDSRRKLGVRVENGYPPFGIESNEKVYVIERDLFAFYFIKEKGQLRVLALGIGN